MEETSKKKIGVHFICVSPGPLIIGQRGSSAAVLGGGQLKEAGPDDSHDEDDDQDVHEAGDDDRRQNTIGQKHWGQGSGGGEVIRHCQRGVKIAGVE